MKKVLLLLAVVLVGCTAEETATKKEVAKDCNCNRVAAALYTDVLGTKYYYYRTINECSLLQSDWISNGSTSVKIGDCK